MKKFISFQRSTGLMIALVAQLVLPGPLAMAQSCNCPTEKILALRTLLVEHSFAALDSTLRMREALARSDVREEAVLLNSFDAFVSGDSLLQRHLDAWVTANPNAAMARVARGVYFLRMAQAAKAHGPFAKESDAAYQEIVRWVMLADRDADAAAPLDSTSVMPSALRLDVSMFDADLGQRDRAMQTIIDRWPSTVLLRTRYMEWLSPRYHGSEMAVVKYAVESQRHRASNSAIEMLVGIPSFERGLKLHDEGKFDAAVAALSSALSNGEYWRFREARAIAYLALNRFQPALDDLSLAIAARPGHAPLLSRRAFTYAQLAKAAPEPARTDYMVRAMTDLRLAAMVDRTDPQLLEISGGRLDTLLAAPLDSTRR